MRICGTKISCLKLVVFITIIRLIFFLQELYMGVIIIHKKIENIKGQNFEELVDQEELPVHTTEVEPEIINEVGVIEYSTFSEETPTIAYNQTLETFLSSNEITNQGIHLEWVVANIRQGMKEWEKTHKLIKKRNILQKIRKKSILLYMGLLHINMGKDALNGGPVGELVQWSSLIVGLNMLGHNIDIVKDANQFELRMQGFRHYDLIIADYLGLYYINEKRYFQNLCKFRILDSFGTDPQFNIRTFAKSDKSLYEQYNLPDTRQIWTFYPLNPDNSFLGFTIHSREQHKPNNSKRIALVYGKVAAYMYFYPNTINVLKLVSEYMEIHFTMSPGKELQSLPFEAINHGVLSQDELANLLDKTHLFVGLGFPFIGPGPFDALAHGCTFLQPSFEIPKNRDTDAFFHGKPTMLTLNSQHSYLEKFADPDYVYTLDYNNMELVKEIVQTITKRAKLPPYVPYEFTGVGFVERLTILTEKLQTCNSLNVALEKVPILSEGTSFEYKSNIDKVTDGVWAMDSCFTLMGQDSKRSYIRFAFESTIWVWEIVLKLSPTWNVARNKPSPHIDIELSSENGQILQVRSFFVDRVSIEWLWINTSNVANVRLYSDVNINICEFELYSNESYRQLWPNLDILEVRLSKPGESCSTTCFKHELICARNLFPMLDSIEYLKQNYHCRSYITDVAGPAIDVSHSSRENCIRNTDSMLYSCITHRNFAIRICPCVLGHPRQNGVPLVDAFN